MPDEAEMQERIKSLEFALTESLRLQSHYAVLLNRMDGGNRMQFATADEWMRRLSQTRLA